jgi:hypothetical protein
MTQLTWCLSIAFSAASVPLPGNVKNIAATKSRNDKISRDHTISRVLIIVHLPKKVNSLFARRIHVINDICVNCP